MASNRIITKKFLAMVEKKIEMTSHKFILEAATETETFKRTEETVEAAKSRLITMVQESDQVFPTDTKKVVVP